MTYRVSVRVYDDLPPVEVDLPSTIEQYRELWASIERENQQGHQEAFKTLLRLWTLADQFFLLRYVLSAGRDAWDSFRGRPHFDHESHIELARTLQFDPQVDNYVVIGARGWGKSSHHDADDIQAKLRDPNHTTCFFSLTKDLAKKRIETVQREVDTSELLHLAWPERFWRSEEERVKWPGKPPWSAGTGLCIKRTTSRPEQTWEAHSFEYALPTGMHFDRRRYDDIEAERAVERTLTAAIIESRWISSQNLTSSMRQRRVAGTYYSPNAMMVKLETHFGLKTIRYPGEDTKDPVHPDLAGPLGGRPVNGFTREHLWKRLQDVGGAEIGEDGNWRKTSNQSAIVDYARQTACDPMAGEAMKLSWEWLRTYEGDGTRYAKDSTIVVCADCSPGDGGDPTAVWVWALTPKKEFVWVDGEMKVVDPALRRKLIHDVCQRWINLGALVAQLRLEQFGQAQYVQDQEEYWRGMPKFAAPKIIKCNDNRSPARGEGKTWTIFERWQPNAAGGKILVPKEMWRHDERGVPIDLVAFFKRYELEMFPSGKDNLLDAGKLIWEDTKRAGELPWPVDVYSLKEQKPAQRTQHYQGAGLL